MWECSPIVLMSAMTRLSITEAETEALEKLVEQDPSLANGFRLLTDASLLFDFGRYSSVVALAVLSMEEVGKYLIAQWSNSDASFRYDKHKRHKMKQGAVAALFLCDSARREARARGIDFAKLNSPEAFAELAKAIMAGLEKEKAFAGAVLSNVIEAVKWSGLYYDKDIASKGIEPSKITAENATELMQQCTRAFMLLPISGNIEIAKIAFGYIHPQQ